MNSASKTPAGAQGQRVHGQGPQCAGQRAAESFGAGNEAPWGAPRCAGNGTQRIPPFFRAGRQMLIPTVIW